MLLSLQNQFFPAVQKFRYLPDAFFLRGRNQQLMRTFYCPLFRASIYLCSIPAAVMRRKLKVLLVVEIVVCIVLTLFLAWLGVQIG